MNYLTGFPDATLPLQYCRSLWRGLLPSWIKQFPLRLFFVMLSLASLSPWPMARAEDGDLGNFNTAEGAFALDMVGSGGGKYNTAIGYGALHLDTAGTNNTADGGYALTANVTGNYNVANGFSALASNKDGSSNTADGYRTLNLNTSGSFNTAMGFGALTSNATGIDNTAIGSGALSSSNSASFNTAIGFNALESSTASNNTAAGFEALFHNTIGTQNTAMGGAALFSNTTGNNNTATSFEALFSNTTGSNNTACGELALENNTNGSSNIALGFLAGSNLTTGSNNIDIGAPGTAGESKKIRIGKQGTQIATFIAGIYNVNEGGTIKPLYINSNGQLGTQAPASARRFKKEIKPMDQTSEAILGLKPVTFQYKDDSTGTPQFGLIAEEVAKADPDLVVRDDDGEIYTVRYEAVNAMLLNEFLKEHKKVEEQDNKLQKQGATIAQQQKDFKDKFTQQQKQIEALTASVQRVSDKVELSQSASQIVAKNQ
jgi:hypothetical protein